MNETPLNIRTHGIRVGPILQSYIERRIASKLGKYARHLTRVTVRFDDESGPKGGPDTHCRVKVVIVGLPSVIVEDAGTSARQAFDLAVEIVDHSVLRVLERRSRSASRQRQARLRRGAPPPEAWLPA